jgi:Tol biopolymer transport system component
VGELQQLTHDAAGDVMPAISRDGNKMVFVSLRPGNQEVWIKSLQTGQESVLTASRLNKWAPTFSPDGSQVAFAESSSWNVYIMPSAGGAPEMVCAGCGQVTDWSPDGKRILGSNADGRAWVLDLASRRKTDLLATRHWIGTDAFSPDGRWFSFIDLTSGRGYIAPVSEVPIAEIAWIDIMDGEPFSWSPDGNLLYGESRRDGHDCIWAQRVDPVTKRPVGAFAVFHIHNLRWLGGEDPTLGVAGNRMVFCMGERTGNIWMAEWKRGD